MAELIIEAGRTEGQYWRDLWRFRELFYVLAWRDITVRYKQTAIGVLWAILQPLINSILLTAIFHRVAGIPSVGTVPYFLATFVAQMPWQFFSSALSGASQSVVGSANLISKVYFPRLIVPAGAVVTSLADLFISLWLLVGIMAWYHYLPTWHIVFLPFFIALAFLVAMGPGLLITALTVKYRDFRYITPVLLQVGQIVSPIGYSTAYILSKYPDWRNIYPLNPMVGVIDGFRWAVLGDQAPLDPRNLLISIAATIIFMILGVWFFRRTEKSFADVI